MGLSQVDRIICSTCKESLSVDLFYVDKSRPSGYSSRCKPCVKVYHKQWYRDNKEKRDKQKSEYKQNNRDRVLSKAKEYADKNKQKIAERTRQWYRKNREVVLAKQRQYYRDTYEENPAKYAEKYRARHARRQAQYQLLTAAARAEVDGLYLFTKIFQGFEVDHILPFKGRTVSGLHNPQNLQVLPIKENRSKSNKFTKLAAKAEEIRLMNFGVCEPLWYTG